MTTELILSILSIPIGFYLLVYTSDKFVEGAAAIANNFGVSHAIIGITIIGFATSSPEILISVFAALDNNSGIAVGNVIGSNITNTGLILGLAAMLYTVSVKSSLLFREFIMMIAVMFITLFMMMNKILSRTEGLILLTLLVVIMAWLTYKEIKSPGEEINEDIPDDVSTKTALTWLLIGLVGMVLSSKLLVWGAVNIAQTLGVSDLVIGLTIIALGTSLPELAATLSSVKKGQHDLAVGNIIGSNLFNLLAVLGIAACITPIPIEHDALFRDTPVLFGITGALLIFCFIKHKSKKHEYGVGHIGGGLLLVTYLAYQAFLILSALSFA